MFRRKKDGLNEKVEGFLEKGHLTKNFNRSLALAVTYMFLVFRLQPLRPMDSCLCACVCVTAYLESRTSDFDDTTS